MLDLLSDPCCFLPILVLTLLLLLFNWLDKGGGGGSGGSSGDDEVGKSWYYHTYLQDPGPGGMG